MSGVAAWWAEHWEFVLGIVIGGALGALINWIFYRKAGKPKRLAWGVMSSSRQGRHYLRREGGRF